MTNREQKLLPSARQLTSVRRTSNLNSLTGLPERLDFLRQVQQLLTEKKLNGWCVLSIDIEHFKLFNNWYGQVQGDELLHTIGHQLAQLAKENDYIAGYFGGDDFFLCMPDDDKRAQAVYDLIFHCIEDYQQLDSFLPLLGICPVDEHSDDISVLCNNAQIASGAVRGKRITASAAFPSRLCSSWKNISACSATCASASSAANLRSICSRSATA